MSRSDYASNSRLEETSMPRTAFRRTFSGLLLLLTPLSLATAQELAPRHATSEAHLLSLGSRVVFELPHATFDSASLRIAGASVDMVRDFDSGEDISVDLFDESGSLADGSYHWEIQLVSGEESPRSGRGRAPADDGSQRLSGEFRIVNGLVVLPQTPSAGSASADAEQADGLHIKVSADAVTTDDVVVIPPETGGLDTGGLCVGYDCGNPTHTFPAALASTDTSWLDLNGEQTAIQFTDTTSMEPTWQLSANNGANQFTLTESGVGDPFNVVGGAADDAFFIGPTNTSAGARGAARLGIGTATPTDDINLTVQGGTADATISLRPTGFDWLLSAAPSSFSILDNINDLILFDIASTAASDSFVLAPASPAGEVRVGFGTATPTSTVHVIGEAGEAQLRIQENASNAAVEIMFNLECDCAPAFRMQNTTNSEIWFFRHTAAGDFSFDNVAGSGLEARLSRAGDLFLKGSVFQSSSRTMKENLDLLQPHAVLDSLAGLKLYEWSYIGDEARHIGPTAEDFSATYGVGANPRSIAPADMAGVALAAAQALREQNRTLESKNAALEAKNAALEAGLADLLARVEALEQQQ